MNPTKPVINHFDENKDGSTSGDMDGSYANVLQIYGIESESEPSKVIITGIVSLSVAYNMYWDFVIND